MCLLIGKKAVLNFYWNGLEKNKYSENMQLLEFNTIKIHLDKKNNCCFKFMLNGFCCLVS